MGREKIASSLQSAPEDDENDVTDGTINDGLSVVTPGFATTHAEEADVATHDGHPVEPNGDLTNVHAIAPNVGENGFLVQPALQSAM